MITRLSAHVCEITHIYSIDEKISRISATKLRETKEEEENSIQ